MFTRPRRNICWIQLTMDMIVKYTILKGRQLKMLK